MSKYPAITDALLADVNADDCAAYDAARGDEDAQLWLARLFSAKAEAASSHIVRAQSEIMAVGMAGFAAAHGKVEAVRFYRDCLSRHRAGVQYERAGGLEQDERIERLTAAILGKGAADRVEVRI